MKSAILICKTMTDIRHSILLQQKDIYQSVVEALVCSKTCDPNVAGHCGITPLYVACSMFAVEVVKVLLESSRCNVNMQASNGQSPLHVVVKASPRCEQESIHCESIARLLLEVPHCNPLVADSQGVTPLQIALKSKPKIFIMILERRCVEPYSKTKEVIEQAMKLTDNSLLHLMTHLRATKAMKNILNCLGSPVIVNRVEASSGDTPLMAAVVVDCVEAVELLLDSQYCDPNVSSAFRNGDTPLIAACKMAEKHHSGVQSYFQMVRLLLANDRCDPNKQNEGGDTALHIVVAENYEENIKCLVQCGRYKPDVRNKLGETPLHIACSQLNIQAVTVLLKEGRCDIDTQTNTGQTPLHLVLNAKVTIRKEWEEHIAHLLLSVPDCDPHIGDAQGVTPLEIAHRTNNRLFTPILGRCCVDSYSKTKEVVKQAMTLTKNNLLHVLTHCKALTVMRCVLKLQGSPAIVNKHEDSSGDTPLVTAIKTEYVDAIKLLLESQYCDPNVKTVSNGDTPLILVCQKMATKHHTGDHLQMLQLLLSSDKCDVNSRNCEGNTALHIAAAGSCQEAVTALIGHERCKPDIMNNRGETPLHVACGKLDVPIVTTILQDRKGNINQQTTNGQTPLHLLVEAKEIKPGSKLKLIHLLLSYPNCNNNGIVSQDTNQQCDPNVRNSSSKTPLHTAVEAGACDVLEAILSNEHCDPNVQNDSGETPLHIACILDRHTCVVALTRSKHCSINIPNNVGVTALHHAINSMFPGKVSIVEHLISDSRCDVAACDLQGNTALHIACMKAAYKEDEGIVTVIRLLLSTGKVDPQCVNNAGETPAQLAISNQKVYQELSHFSETQLNHPIQTYVKVFVVGNAETGKSTLIEAICTEASKGRKYVPSQFKTVKGVKLHTAGIVPIPVQSRHFGNAIFYDFAGQHEYYSSHAAVLENLVLSSPPVFLVLVDLSEPFEQMSEIIAYWWSYIGSYTARSHLDTPPQVIVAGSHKDVVKSKGKKVLTIAAKLLGTLDGLPSNFVHTGFTALNCTLVASDGLTTLLSLLKKACETLRKEVHVDLRCHVLSAFLQDEFSNSMACTLADIMESIKSEDNIVLPQSTSDLVNLLAALSDKDRILLLKNSEFLEKSWIILQRQKLYGEVNGSIFAPEYFDEHLTDFARSTGVVPLSKIKKHFPQHHPDIITGFLSHLEFCFKIGDAQTLELIADEEEYLPDEEFYFFPALVQVKNPPKEKVWKDEVQSLVSKQAQQKLKYGWFYECSHPHQYLMTRFLHVLQFRLAFSFALAMEHRQSHIFPAIRRRCSVWKRGISWLNNDGIETVLEVGLQNQWVVLLMQCSVGMEVDCAKLQSAVVKIILDTKEEFCPSIGMYESLLHPCNIDYPFQRTDQLYLYHLKEVSRVLVQRRLCAVDEGGSNLTKLVELLPFELYTGLGQVFLTQLFTSEYAHQKVTDHFLKEISQILLRGSDTPMERLKLLVRAFLPQVVTELVVDQEVDPVFQCVNLIQKAGVKTFQNLEKKLSSCSIFCGRNLLDLASLSPAAIIGVTDYEHNSLLEQMDDSLLGINSLLEVRTEVDPAVGHSTSLGLALGLSQAPTLQVIQHNWPDDISFQLTEIMAAWLQSTENSSWKSLVKALLNPAVDCPKLACAMIEQHSGCPSDTSDDGVMYQDVDETLLDESFPGDILPVVVQGGHFSWFHLGLVLGLHYGTLKIIQIEHTSYTKCIAVVITKWLNQVDLVRNQGQPSWRVLARALAHPLVRQQRLADDIARDHPAQEAKGTSGNVSLPEMANLHSSESPQPLHPLCTSPSPPPATPPPCTSTPPPSSDSSSPPHSPHPSPPNPCLPYTFSLSTTPSPPTTPSISNQ